MEWWAEVREGWVGFFTGYTYFRIPVSVADTGNGVMVSNENLR